MKNLKAMSKNNSTASISNSPLKEGFYLNEERRIRSGAFQEERLKTLHTPLSLEFLPEGWFWCGLDDISIGVYDCPHTTPIHIDNGVFFSVRTQDVSSGKLDLKTCAKVSEKTYNERVSRAVPQYGDLVYSREGTYFGIAAEVPKDTKVCLGQRMVLIRPISELINFSFLKWWLNSSLISGHIKGFYDGSVAERLNLPVIRTLPIALPPLSEQKAIAAVLGSLDDKIELLREQNETLETLAQTLFKRWFIDFNFPDENGKPYKDNGGTMTPSDLGEIPERWRCSSIYEMAEYINGAAFKPKQFSLEDKGLAVIKIAELKSGITKQTKFCEEMLAEKYYIDNGEVLFSWSGSPETSIDAFIWVGKPAYLNQHIFKVVSKIFGKGANYFLLKSLMPRFINIAKQKQTTGLGHVTVADLKEQQIAIPNCSNNFDTECFEKKFEKILSNTQQIQTLTHLRDTLLPKLMKGEIRIK